MSGAGPCGSGIGPVVVACAEAEIADAVTKAGGHAVLTRPDHPSGSDRIFEALQTIDPSGSHDAVVNVQGDLPTIAPETIRAAYDLLNVEGVDIGTLAVEIEDAASVATPTSSRRWSSGLRAPGQDGRCTHAGGRSRGEAPLLHHIGLYAYRRPALARFVSLPSYLEQQEKLEQLRALAAGMRIDVAIVDAVPLGVDTPADLARARVMLVR